MTKIFLASDHAGVEVKSKVIELLRGGEYLRAYEVHDLGPQSTDSVDYPDYADLVCRKMHGFTLIESKDTSSTHPSEIGILICGSGQGMCMRANKYQAIRAALCWLPQIAHLAREHNDANILCLGARVVDIDTNLKIVEEFLRTPFAGGRHRQRVVKIGAQV